jgi:WD40 repeat protein
VQFEFPAFAEPVPIGDGRVWTANYESYDQRLDDVFYTIWVGAAGGPARQLTVSIGLYWAGDDWSDPAFADRLRAELHAAAVRGESNTRSAGRPGQLPFPALPELVALTAERGVEAAVAAVQGWPWPVRNQLVAVLKHGAELLGRAPDQLPSQLRGRLDPAARGHAELVQLLDDWPVPAPAIRLVSTSLPPVWSPCLGRLLPTDGRLVHAVAVLPDGDTCVLATENDGPMRVLSLSTMEQRTLDGHVGPVNHLAVCPETGLLVSAGDDRTVRVWDVPAGRAVHVLSGHTHFVRQVAVAAGRVVSASQDGTVRVWELSSGQCRHVLAGHRLDVMAVAISADGRTAVSSAMDNAVLVWDLDRGTLARTVYDTRGTVHRFEMDGAAYLTVPDADGDPGLHEDCPVWLAVSDGGRQVVSAGTEVIWSDVDGTEVERVDWPGYIQAAALHPDGSGLAAGGPAGLQLSARGGAGPVTLTAEPTTAVTYTPDGGRLLSGSHAGAVDLWRAEIEPAWAARVVHRNRLRAVRVAPGGRFAATGDASGATFVWDLAGGRRTAVIEDPEPDAAFAFTPAGDQLLTGSLNRLRRWDCATGRELPAIAGPGRPPGEPVTVTALGWLPDGHTLLAGGPGHIGRWALDSGERRRFTGDTGRVSRVEVTGDGRLALTVATVFPDGGAPTEWLQCWDVGTGTLRWTVEAAHPSPGRPAPELPFTALAVLGPDGESALTMSERQPAVLVRRDLATGRPLRELPLPGTVVAHRVLPDALLVATTPAGSAAAAVHWVAPDLSGVHRSAPIRARRNLAFLPDGRHCLASPPDALSDLVLLDLDQTSPLARLSADARIDHIAVADTGGGAVATDRDGHVHILRIVTR